MNSVLFSLFAADPACVKSFLGVPPWYKYLEAHKNNNCAPEIHQINDFWLIGLAGIEILTRIAVFVAIGFIIYGGIKYSMSRGNTDRVNSAKSTLIDALTGLVIAVIATASVSFIAGRFAQP